MASRWLQTVRMGLWRCSLTATLLLLVVYTIALPLLSGMLHIPRGLPVHLVRKGIAPQFFPLIRPLQVHIESTLPGERPNLYIDTQPVAWRDLPEVLRRELRLRPPNWPVYVKGDADLEWGDVAKAVDIIRGLNAEVVLLSSADGK